MTALHKEEEFRKQLEAIFASIWGKFVPLDSEDLDRIEHLLDDESVGRLSTGDLDFFQQILEIHQRTPDRERRELRWAERVSIDHPSISEYGSQRLKTEEAKSRLRARIDVAHGPDAPPTFEEALDSHRLSLRFLQSAEAIDTAALEEVLRNISNPHLISDLRKFLWEARTPTQQLAEISPFLPPFVAALSSVLEKLSGECEMNKIRVNAIRRTPSEGIT